MGFWNTTNTGSSSSSSPQTQVAASNDEPASSEPENFWSDPSQEEPQEDVELLENGDFETGNLEGWETLQDGFVPANNTDTESADIQIIPPESGVFVIENGANTPVSNFPTTANPDGGDYIALTDQIGPSAHVLMQDFTVPEDGTDLMLSFDLFANDWSGQAPVGVENGLDLTQANQHVRLEIIEEDADPFSTDDADVVHEFDLGDVYGDEPPDPFTRFAFDDFDDELQAGETYSLRFGEAVTQYFLHLGVDNVSLISNPSDDIENFWNGDQDESDPAPPENFWNGGQDDSEQAPPENFWSQAADDDQVEILGVMDSGDAETTPEPA